MMLLIHDERNDPIVKLLTNERTKLEEAMGEPLVTVSLKKILQDVTIYDVIEDGRAKIEWTFPDGTRLSNTDHVKLLSRIAQVPRELFTDFHPEDQEYAQTEFSAYLHFALGAFPCKMTEPRFFGLSGEQLPMPLQWHRVQKANLGVRFPAII